MLISKSGIAAIALSLLAATPALAQSRDGSQQRGWDNRGQGRHMSRDDMRMLNRCERLPRRAMMRSRACMRVMAMQQRMYRRDGAMDRRDDRREGRRDHRM